MSKLQSLIIDAASVKVINQELMMSNNIYGIYDTDSIKKQYAEVFVKFDKYINTIGIFTLPSTKYLKSQENINKYIRNKKLFHLWYFL